MAPFFVIFGAGLLMQEQRAAAILERYSQGYRRVDGDIVEDPDSAPAIKEIFQLYATGRFSFRTWDRPGHLRGRRRRAGGRIR